MTDVAATTERLLDRARAHVDQAVDRLRDADEETRHDIAGHEVATAAVRLRAAEALQEYGRAGDLEARLALVFAGRVCAELAAAASVLPSDDGARLLEDMHPGLRAARDPRLLDDVGARLLAEQAIPQHLDPTLDMIRQTFRDYAEQRVAPVAEAVHRNDDDVPEWIISDLAELGCFGLSIPERFGGSLDEGAEDTALASMLIVTEELSRGSLGIAGSLITRPEMITRALLSGGTPEQQQRWLPAIAAGDVMCGIAVTEPDHGSDVANLRLRATRDGDHYVLDGTKTWCTFAGRAELLLVLARTGTAEERHRGLSMFIVEKPAFPGHKWTHDSPDGGRMQARAISTLGYRGMHSFEISFEGLRVPAANVIGGEDGLGRGFYLQMEAFATGRLQTAARAVGVMQAAFDAAIRYADERHVFGRPLGTFGLTRGKLAIMAAEIAAARQLAHAAAASMADGGGTSMAAMAKSMACRAAEYVTREAQQLHGGMGYAEEYAVSRYFVDARVLSIFEGADEVLLLKVILPSLLGR